MNEFPYEQNLKKEMDVSQVSRLLRGELSAVETYKQAIEKFDDSTTVSDLRRLCSEHEQAVIALQGHISSMGAVADTSSGVWGAWAKAVEGTAKLFGETAALKALKEGEEHGLNEYHEVLEDTDLPAVCREFLNSHRIYSIKEHIDVLDRCMARVE